MPVINPPRENAVIFDQGRKDTPSPVRQARQDSKHKFFNTSFGMAPNTIPEDSHLSASVYNPPPLQTGTRSPN
jgi:hypothetical protein